jgi:hypothetical protein
MKRLHRPDLYAWSVFDETRNIDFNSVLVRRPSGNVVVDPLPLSPHDRAHLDALGGAEAVVVTNSDHLRCAVELAQALGARLLGPAAEALPGFIGLGDGDMVSLGIQVLALEGSKTPGELALLVDGGTLITGDLIRCHAGGTLCLLPPPKLTDAAAAHASARRLADLPVDAVLVGDGYPVFRDGQSRLRELVASL